MFLAHIHEFIIIGKLIKTIVLVSSPNNCSQLLTNVMDFVFYTRLRLMEELQARGYELTMGVVGQHLDITSKGDEQTGREDGRIIK